MLACVQVWQRVVLGGGYWLLLKWVKICLFWALVCVVLVRRIFTQSECRWGPGRLIHQVNPGKHLGSRVRWGTKFTAHTSPANVPDERQWRNNCYFSLFPPPLTLIPPAGLHITRWELWPWRGMRHQLQGSLRSSVAANRSRADPGWGDAHLTVAQ